ncbi:MAG: hypothetical protein AB1Z98_29580, partial [Nannocystaceae bacterium]
MVDEPAASSEPVVEVPVVDGQWRPVLPAIDLETLDDAERQRGAECFETHGVTNPEVSLGELMAAAACLRGARQYGREVSM